MLIAIDHGNKQMKTIHSRPFVSGLVESIAGFIIRNLARENRFFHRTAPGSTTTRTV